MKYLGNGFKAPFTSTNNLKSSLFNNFGFDLKKSNAPLMDTPYGFKQGNLLIPDAFNKPKLSTKGIGVSQSADDVASAIGKSGVIDLNAQRNLLRNSVFNKNYMIEQGLAQKKVAGLENSIFNSMDDTGRTVSNVRTGNVSTVEGGSVGSVVEKVEK